jgi:hypothetical protein
MYKVESGAPFKVDSVFVDPGGRGHTYKVAAFYLGKNHTQFYFNNFNNFKIDSTILKYKQIRIWFKKFRFDKSARDVYQIEADGKLIYPYDYARSYRKIGWLLLGMFFYRLGKNDSFRLKVLRWIGLLRDDKNLS